MKKTYYVSVQSGSVLEDQGADSFEFEISATDKEIAELQEMFEFREEADNASFRLAHIPGIPYHQQEQDNPYEDGLRAVYQTIHRLGTHETKKQIEEMGLA